MKIWPAIDIRGGKCVRLVQGDYDRETVYGTSPADMAARWTAEGADCLHVVNLDGAKNGRDALSQANLAAIEKLASEVDVPIQIGGGIRDDESVQQYMEMGIKRFVVGTRALKDEVWTTEIIERYPEQIIIGIDARNGFVAIDGWANVTDVLAIGFARKIAQLPIAGIIYTDISKDGMLEGPNLEAMAEMSRAVDVPVIAAGGITTPDDVASLATLGLSGCIIGRALYEGRLSLTEALSAADSGVSAGEV